MRLRVAALAALLALAAPAAASAAACPKTTLGDVEDEVMCLVCGTPLGLATEAPQANRERALIQEMVDDCRSKQQIKDRLVAEYGDRVLALPGDKGFDLAAYLVPALRDPARRRRADRGDPAVAGRPPAGARAGGLRPRGRRSRQAPGRRRHGAVRPVTVLAAGTVDTTVFAAFAAGFVSFISPCVLPLVPGYLSAISGLSFAEIQAGKGRAQVLGPALVFVLSFTIMFVALGMTATGIGSTLQDHRLTLRKVSGVILIVMGVFFIATLFIERLNREWRPEELMRRAGTGGPIVAGLAFAVAWLPCTGPTLSAVFTAAGNKDTVAQGGVLLAFYSFGLGVPFVLSALAFERVSGIFKFFRDHYRVITWSPGLILIAMGVPALHRRADAAERRRPALDGRPRHQLLLEHLAPATLRASLADTRIALARARDAALDAPAAGARARGCGSPSAGAPLRLKRPRK